MPRLFAKPLWARAADYPTFMKHIPPPSQAASSGAAHPCSRRAGFSLVEVVLALGVVALAFIGIFSMLPTGLTIFRQAMDTSIGAQISQRIVGEAQQTDFDALVPGNQSATQTKKTTIGGDGGQFYAMPLRYFDDQGTEIPFNDLSTDIPPAGDPRTLKIVYTARVRGSMPGVADPSSHSSSYFTSLPATTGTRFNPRAVTFLTIQIFKNAGHKAVASLVDTSGTYLIDPTLAAKANLTVQTYTAIVARNGYHKKIGT